MLERLSDWLTRRQLLGRVRKHGWTAIGVGDGEADSWSYSLGFCDLDAPEIVMCGVPQQFAHNLMWEAYRQIRDGRLALSDMAPWNLDEDLQPVWRKVHPSHIAQGGLNLAAWYREQQGLKTELEAFQLVFHDQETKLFPWDDGCPPRARDGQRHLYEPVA